MNLLVIILAAIATWLSYNIGQQGFRQTSLDSPRLVAAAGAALVGLGMLQLGNVVVTIILIPAATAGVSLLLLWLLRWLLRIGAVNYFRRLLAEVVSELRKAIQSTSRFNKNDHPNRKK